MKKLLLAAMVLALFAPSSHGQMSGQQGQQGMMGGSMMAQGMMRAPMMPMGGGMPGEMQGEGVSPMRMLHRWAPYFFGWQDVGITEGQTENIRGIFLDHIKYSIPKQAERRVLQIEIEQLLLMETIDLMEVEKKMKRLESLGSEMAMEGVRTMTRAFDVLDPEQRKKLKSLFRKFAFAGFTGMSPGTGGATISSGMMGSAGAAGTGGTIGQGRMMGMMGQGGVMETRKASPSSLTQTNAEGQVTVVVTYHNPQEKAEKSGPIFKVEMNTHSVELGQYDLKVLSALRKETGDAVGPLRWESSAKEGHHVSGTLVFPDKTPSGKPVVAPDTEYLELVLRSIGGVGERVFRWPISR